MSGSACILKQETPFFSSTDTAYTPGNFDVLGKTHSSLDLQLCIIF